MACKTRRTARALAAILATIVLAPLCADAAFVSEVSVYSILVSFPDQTAGGSDVPTVTVFGHSTDVLPDHSQGFSGLAFASATDGRLETRNIGTAVVDSTAPDNRLGGSGESRAQFQDAFTIGAGDSGLAAGDPAQVLLQVRLDGKVVIGGFPAGSSYYVFEVRTHNPFPALAFGFELPPSNPPADQEYHEYSEFLVDTEIGQTIQLDVFSLNQTGHTVWLPGSEGSNFIVFDGQVRIVHAPGFEDVEIDSEAGAPGTPLVLPGDADRDGVENATDNCLTTFNPGQDDTDLDGIGNACDTDLNNDCIVNFLDLAELKTVFFSTDAEGDFNNDGSVNFADLSIMRRFFFGRPGPSGQLNLCPAVVFADGTFTVHPTLAFDLDLGVESLTLDPPSDVLWEAVTAIDSALAPLNGSAIVEAGLVQPTFEDCTAAALATHAVGLWSLEIGSWVCARTDSGRIARLRILSADTLPLSTATEMEIEFTSWQ